MGCRIRPCREITYIAWRPPCTSAKAVAAESAGIFLTMVLSRCIVCREQWQVSLHFEDEIVPNALLVGIGKLSVKMRMLKAYYGSSSDAAELNDRQVLILEILADQGPLSITELTRRLHGDRVAQSTISSDVKGWRLADNPLVEIQLDQEDIRKHLVTLTEMGRQKVDEIRQQRQNAFAELAKAMPQDPEKVQAVKEVIDNAIRFVDEKLASFDNDHG